MSRGEDPAKVTAVAWHRAAGARERARRALEAAHEQEALAVGAERDIHLRIATTHRKIAAAHLSTARLQEAYARRMAAWSRRREPRPLFMTGVAEACGATSAALTLVGQDRAQLAVAASDDASRAAQELEFILEEGPVRDATRCHGLVSAAGPAAIEQRWPGYGPELTGLGLSGVVAVPLEATGLCIGALTLYDPRPDTRGFETCTEVAEGLTQTVLLGPDPDPELYGGTNHRDLVHRAAGAHAVRTGRSVADALALIKARAFARGVATETVARQILARSGDLP
ncbi:hypothetical protein GCM10010129_47090 [Streptomyces fumigatiscleroticus]|nr:hypothetical protein GCM10010129_47090 [Streptomyces fumigatiscleroticus]